MERHFFSNLSARELENERKAPINQRFANHLLERDLHLADFEVKQNSPSMGKTLKELNFRQKCNVNIVTIDQDTSKVALQESYYHLIFHLLQEDKVHHNQNQSASMLHLLSAF